MLYLPSCGITGRSSHAVACWPTPRLKASAIDRVIEQNPGDAQAGLRCLAAWRTGKEIDAGFWYLAEADAALFFRP